ncbi:MAG TPA: alpha/beta fold hydrolase [Humibacter sp.]|nr:alpha/beta fold hydrolase [Humibacter sp.]
MTFVLIPGAGGTAWYWHRVQAELAARGHDAVAVELPAGRADDLAAYADAVVEAAGEPDAVTLVAQSMGGFTAALAAERLPVRAIVFLNAMIPVPGETPSGWWDAVGHADAMRTSDLAAGRDPAAPFDLATYFLHDLSDDLAAQLSQHGGQDTAALFGSICDFARWPDVPMRVMAGRDDRFFPLDFQRGVARDRLGSDVDEVPGGHLAALSHPAEVAQVMLDFGFE